MLRAGVLIVYYNSAECQYVSEDCSLVWKHGDGVGTVVSEVIACCWSVLLTSVHILYRHQ